MDVNANDFTHMWEMAADWGPDWAVHDGRFLNVDTQGTVMPSYDYRKVYWFGHRYVEILLARVFLDAHGFSYEVLWDTAVHPSGREMGFLIVTDYVEEA